MAGETYNYETFYDGGYSSLSSNYGNFIGYRLPVEKLGSTTSIQTANQVNEVVSRIREGVKAVELQPIQPDVFEQIPKQQFEEIRALAKLTGVKSSVHAPMIDPAGFGERGWQGDLAREDAERRLFSVIKKSHELDPEGNIPIVIHSSGGVPGAEYRPKEGTKPGEEGRFEEKKIIVINQENPSQMSELKEERKFYPGVTTAEEFEKGGTLHEPMKDVEAVNNTEWTSKLTNLAFYKKESDEVFGALAENPQLSRLAKQEFKTSGQQAEFFQENPGVYNELKKASLFLQNTHQTMNSLFDKAYKYGSDGQKKELRKMSEQWAKEQRESMQGIANPIREHAIDSQLLNKYFTRLQGITGGVNPYTGKRDKHWGAPEVYVPVEKFAMGKAAETFGNLAYKSYKEFGNSAPIIAVENMYQGMAFSRAEDMEKLVKKSKKVFVERAIEKGMSESAAKNQADKLIGVTWDVGHLNIIRKAGFKEEDVVKETEKIAKLVKHIHLTDNFGYSDSHLAPGMGNVPFKEILEKLEKAGALKDARGIIEAGALTNPNMGLKMSPLAVTMKAFGSPIYGAKMAPYWNQTAGIAGNYFGSPLAYMPEKHFSTYGSGFSSLPEELGGQIPGTQSRFSGTQNA